MSREKQTFGVESITELPCWQGAKQCWCEVECEDCIESHLLAAGWRKQSEVAREIFEEIERILLLNKVCFDSGIYYEHDVEWDIAELKMKYTEEQT